MIFVRVEPELARAFAALAATQERSLSGEVRHAMRLHLTRSDDARRRARAIVDDRVDQEPALAP
jgi:hypothetical protein